MRDSESNETGALMGEGRGDFKARHQSKVSVSSSTHPSPRKIDKNTIAQLNAQVA